MTPITIIAGAAGSGKDTLAYLLSRLRNIACIAQADPMKVFARDMFGFTDIQLWGPSQARNEPDTRFGSQLKLEELFPVFERVAERWLRELQLYHTENSEGVRSGKLLEKWLRSLCELVDTTGHLSPRMVLQTLGTEFGRSIDPDVWSKYAIQTAMKLLKGGYKYDHQLVKAEYSGYDRVLITDGRFRNEILNVSAIGGQTISIYDPYPAQEVGIKGHASEAELKLIPPNWFDIRIENDKKKGLDVLKKQALSIIQEWSLTMVEYP